MYKEFSELSGLFQDICIPFLLIAVDDNGNEKLVESETISLNCKYEQFMLKIRQLVKIAQPFLMKTKTPLLDENFINHIDADLYEDVRIFEEINDDDRLQIEKVQSAYSALIMLARLLNTCIKMHNDSNPANKLNLLHNIPDPQFFETG
jgi:hypothetical protein